ncbi:MAG: ECF transporter S component, partial [Actinomycetes bacterium]
MSNIFGAPKAGGPSGPDDARTVPTGDTVGSYTSYLDA